MRGTSNRKWSERIHSLTFTISSRLVVLSLFAMIGIVVYDIVLRTLVQMGIPGTVEINEYLLIIVGFMGITMANRLGGHITVDLLYNKISPSCQPVIDRLNNIILLGFSLVFLYAGFEKAVSAYGSGETGWFGPYVLPVWYFRWTVPISFFLLSVQLVLELIPFGVAHDHRKSRDKI